jgi:hypothetical protein
MIDTGWKKSKSLKKIYCTKGNGKQLKSKRPFFAPGRVAVSQLHRNQ